MADDVTLNAAVGTFKSAADEISPGLWVQRIKVTYGSNGSATDVDASNPLPVGIIGNVNVGNFPSTQVVTGTFWQATQPVSIATLPALAAGSAVIGSVTQSGPWSVSVSNTVPVTGPLTDAQLRAAPVVVHGEVVSATGNLAIVNNEVSLNIDGHSVTTFDLRGTWTGVVVFEASQTSDFASPTVIRAYRAGEKPVLQASSNDIYRCVTPGLKFVRARLASLTSGGPVSVIADAYHDTGIMQLAGPVDLSDQVAINGPAALTAINTDLLTGIVSGWYDASAFQRASLQIISTAGISAGAIFFEATNDVTLAPSGVPWPVEEVTTLTPTPNIAAITIGANSVRLFAGQVVGRYVRVRISTAFAGGSVRIAGVFSQQPYNRMVQTVHQPSGSALVVNANVTGGSIGVSPASGAQIEASAARTATFNGATQTNANARGGIFMINVTAISGAGATLTPKLQIQDSVSTNWIDVPGAVFPAITAVTGVTPLALAVVPGLNEVANSKVNYALPRTFRLAYTITGTTPSVTFSSSIQYVS